MFGIFTKLRTFFIALFLIGILAGPKEVFAGNACSSPDPTCGLVGYWTFDEGSGNLAIDASGNGNNLTLNGTTWGLGKIGGGLLFNGADGANSGPYAQLSGGISSLQDFTFSSWIYIGNTGQRLTVWGTSDSSSIFLISQTFGGTYIKINGNTVVGPSITQGWYHFVVVRSGATVSFYLNDAVQTSFNAGNAPVNFGTSQLGIGNVYDKYWFNGTMSDVRIYNRALSDGSINSADNEIRQIYCLAAGCAVSPSLTVQPPTVYAGVAQTITQSTLTSATATLSGIAYEASQPNTTLTPTWRMVTGPAAVSFTSPNALNTTANFSSTGTYVLSLSATYAGLTSTSNVTITVNPDITPPIITYNTNAGTHPGFLTSGTQQLTMAITTDKPAVCKYSTTPNTATDSSAYNVMPSTFTNTGGTSHSVNISPLTDGNTYSFFIRCQDLSNISEPVDYPVFFSVLSALNGKVIPDDRTIDWTKVGIPGGIPDLPLAQAQTMKDGTVIPAGKIVVVSGAKGDGVSDDTAAIQAAINATNPAGGDVVYIPQGTYNLASVLSINHQLVIRGAGAGLTTLITNVWAPIQIGPSGGIPGNTCAVDLTGGYTKGSQTVSLKDNHCNLQVGQAIVLDEQNDHSLVNVEGIGTCGINGNSCGRQGLSFFTDGTMESQRAMSQIVEITATHFNDAAQTYSIDFDTPLHYTYKPGTSSVDPSGFNPQAFTWGAGSGNMLKYMGVENLSLNANYQQWALDFGFCSFPWVKNVEAYNLGWTAVFFYYTYKGEVINSYFHGTAASTSGPEHYAVELNSGFESLIENNVFYDAGADFVTSGSNGGNVISYNYALWDGIGWQGGTLEPHSSHSFANLFEGNVVPNIILDFIWGSGSHTTIFRNSISGLSPGANNNRFPIILDAWQRFTNIVGNVLGTSGYHKEYELNGETPYSASDHPDDAIYELGFKGQWYDVAVPGDRLIGYDDATEGTLLRHGNFDYVNNSTILDPAISTTLNLPASLYLNQKPSWFDTLAWPSIGPDLGPMSGNIPSQLRYGVLSASTSPDNTAPTVPTSLSANADGTNANLTWDMSWDNIAVAGYKIFRDGTFIGKVDFVNQIPANTTYADPLTDTHAHTYTVSAYDAAGNESAPSQPVSVTANILVSISSPVNNTNILTTFDNVNASVSITANAVSVGTIAQVNFYNGTSLLGAGTFVPGTNTYSYIWNNISTGTYSITAQAIDNTGVIETSAPIGITVQAPVFALSAPANNADLTTPVNIPLQASVSASASSIAKVDFYNGSTLLGTATSSPYAYNWVNVPAGTYTLTAVATGSTTGLTTTTSPVTILVENPPDLTSGLLGYWTFDDGTGTDASGNGYNLGLRSTSLLTPGKIGAGALSFNGTSSFAQLPTSKNLQSMADFTFSAWISMNNNYNGDFWARSDNSYSFGVGSTGNYNFMLSFAGQGVYVPVPSSITYDTSGQTSWFLFTITRSGSVVSVYVNGIASGTTSVNPSTYPVNFSGSLLGIAQAPYWWFHGAMDDVRIYNRALSAKEIAALAAGKVSSASGDVSGNGAVSMYDAALVEQFFQGGSLSLTQQLAAEMDGNSQVDHNDAVAISKKALGL